MGQVPLPRRHFLRLYRRCQRADDDGGRRKVSSSCCVLALELMLTLQGARHWTNLLTDFERIPPAYVRKCSLVSFCRRLFGPGELS